MKIDLTSTVYLLAATQAVLLIGVIVRKKRILYSERYLIAVLGALLLTLLSYVTILNNLSSAHNFFVNLSGAAWYTVSPLLFLYCRALVSRTPWRWSYLAYFPFTIYLLVQTVLYRLGYPLGLWGFFSSAESYYAAWILVYLLNSLFFTGLSLRVLHRADLSEKHRSRLRWLTWWLRGFTAVLVVLSGVLLYWWSASLFYEHAEYALLVFYAVFVYSLVGFSLRFSHYFGMMADEGYRRTPPDPDLQQRYQVVDAYLREAKPFLSTDFKLSDLAQAVNLSENDLSQVFTKHCKSGFYKIVNEHRVAEFERLLREEGTERYTLIALAERAGFASKATFYKAFRERHGITPGQFVKAVATAPATPKLREKGANPSVSG